jgi:hypothetical protein
VGAAGISLCCDKIYLLWEFPSYRTVVYMRCDSMAITNDRIVVYEGTVVSYRDNVNPTQTSVSS